MSDRPRRQNEVWLREHGCSIAAIADAARSFAATTRSAVGIREVAGIPLFLKSRACIRARDRLRLRLGLDEALRAYSTSNRLGQLGIGVAEPVALFLFGSPPTSVLVTEALIGGATLAEWLRPQTASPGNAAEQTPVPLIPVPNLLQQLAAFLADLHRAGVYHSDLHSRNIWVRNGDGGLVFALVDVEAVRLCRQVSGRRRLKNLLRLARNIGTAAAARQTDGQPLASQFADCYFGRAGTAPPPHAHDRVAAAARRGAQRWEEIRERD